LKFKYNPDNPNQLQHSKVGLTQRVQLMEQELLTIPEHLGSPLVFCEDRVAQSLVFYVVFVDHCLSFFF
jgi:hypothetical protein